MLPQIEEQALQSAALGSQEEANKVALALMGDSKRGPTGKPLVKANLFADSHKEAAQQPRGSLPRTGGTDMSRHSAGSRVRIEKVRNYMASLGNDPHDPKRRVLEKMLQASNTPQYRMHARTLVYLLEKEGKDASQWHDNSYQGAATRAYASATKMAREKAEQKRAKEEAVQRKKQKNKAYRQKKRGKKQQQQTSSAMSLGGSAGGGGSSSGSSGSGSSVVEQEHAARKRPDHAQTTSEMQGGSGGGTGGGPQLSKWQKKKLKKQRQKTASSGGHLGGEAGGDVTSALHKQPSSDSGSEVFAEG